MTYRHHSDGGRLRPATVGHDHVIHHSDGSASAIVVRGVPAVVASSATRTTTTRKPASRSRGSCRKPWSNRERSHTWTGLSDGLPDRRNPGLEAGLR